MTKLNLNASALWASAFAIVALIMVQASGLSSPARADLVSQTGSLTALTLTTTNEDVLLVLDGRTEDLYVYRPGRNALDLLQIYKAPDLFNDARARAAGAAR